MSWQKKELYEFGKYRLDVSERLLLRDGRKVTLADKAFDTLCALVRRDNQLVGKDELMREVWANAIVEENNLDKNISALRQVLGERTGKQKFIETVRGHGYRFVQEVRRIELPPEQRASANGLFADEKANSKSKIQDSTFNKTQDAQFQTERQGNVIALAKWKREAGDENEIMENKEVETSASEAAAQTDESFAVSDNDAIPIINENTESSRQTKRHRLALIAALSVVTLAVVGFAFYKFSNQTPARFEAKKITRLTSSGRVKVAAVSPDGKFIAYSQEETNGQQSLWIQHIGSDSKARIAAPAAIEYQGLNISPDGNTIYYSSEKEILYRIPVLGGAAKKIAEGLFVFQNLTDVGISPDGEQIAFVRRFEKDKTALFVADSDGANQRMLAACEPPKKIGPSLSWSPDGKTIITRVQIKGMQNAVAVSVADGSYRTVLPQNWIYVFKTAWLPDSINLLAIGVNDSVSTQIYQINSLSGEARRIVEDTNNYEDISTTADNRFLAAVRTEQIAHVWTMPSGDAAQARQLTAGFEKFDGTDGINWMPDGKIVYSSSPGGKNSTWTVGAQGGDTNQLVKDAAFEAVSPDGRYLVYQKGTVEVGNIGLYRTDLSDGSEIQLTEGTDIWATFSPDGRSVVYTHYGERTGLWKVSISGGEPKLVLDENAICPAVSPDGKTVAFVWRRAGHPNQIALVSLSGGKIIKTFDAELEINPLLSKQNLQWTADGRGIYFVAFDNGISNIWRQPVDGSAPVQVTRFKDGRIFNFAFSPDGKQLALSRGAFNSDVVLIENAK